MNLPRFAVRHRPTIFAAMILITAWGISVFNNVSRYEDPKIVIRAALLVSQWPGASAQKMEQLVTRPLETAIKELPEVKNIISDSRVGLSAITIFLLDNVVDTDTVWTKVRTKIRQVQPTLPQGVFPPHLNSDFGDVSPVVLAIYQVPMPGKKIVEHPYSMREMDDMVKDLEDLMQEIPMVGKIQKYGLQKEVIYIEADARDWGQLAVNASRIEQILKSRNTITPGGTISTSDIDYTVKPSGEFIHIDQINSVVIDSREGTPVHLEDIDVQVSRRYEEPRVKYVRYCSPDLPLPDKRSDCLILALSMRDGYNVVEMGDWVKEKIAKSRMGILPPDLKIEIVSDTPTRVDTAISDFIKNLWLAVVLVLLVALVLIGPRISIIMSTAIPLSMISAIAFMGIFRVDLEQACIAALIIALGMLVDNAVVISDNVLRLMEMGVKKKETVWRGAHELFVPVLTSTLTTVAAFLPMLTIPGDTGEYIRSLPIMVSSTLMASFFIAMTVTPLMCYWMLKEKTAEEIEKAKRRSREELKTGHTIQKGFLGYYGRFMRWGINHKAIILFSATFIFALSLVLIKIIGTAFFPKAASDQFLIDIELPAGSSPLQTQKIIREIEEIMLKVSTVEKDGQKEQRLKNVITYVGKSGPRFYLTVDQEPEKVYYAQMMVNTTSKWHTKSYSEDLRRNFAQITGARIVIKTLDLGPPVKAPVTLRIRGKDLGTLHSLAQQAETVLAKIEGTINVHNSWGTPSYQLAVDIHEEAANLAGVSNLNIANALYGYLSGYKVTTYREGRHEIDVMMRVKPEQRKNLDYLDYLYIEGLHGKVPLNSLASIEPRHQISLIQRRNLIRVIEVRSFVKSGYLGNKVARQAARKMKQEINFPPGYYLEIGGEHEKTQESQGSISKALQYSLLLIIFILVIQFNSLQTPFIILLTMPLVLIGALIGLWISGWPLGFMPLLGIVSLCGVVVNNAIVLIDFIQTLTKEGMPVKMAIIRAGQYRMRPILITTLTTVGGFIPLAISGGPMWQGLAYVMIFGLLISTLLTLIVIPLVYWLFVENFGMKVR